MPSIIPRKLYGKVMAAMSRQMSTGRPSLKISNRPIGFMPVYEPINRNIRLVPKPMRQEDVEAVLKLTGFMPVTETKYVRP